MSESWSRTIDVNAFISEGKRLLKANLESCPSFDLTAPYEEKNKYFDELAQRGNALFEGGSYWLAELYFRELLDEIIAHEQECNKSLNKGMAYANLAVAEMANGKFDVGIADLLTADEEDRPFVQDPHGILNTRLWEQFENPQVFDYLILLTNDPRADLGFTVDKAFLGALFRGMDQQDRIFCEATVWMLRNNLRQNQVSSNVYSRGRLYSGLKDLCLLTESLLRKKQVADGTIEPSSRIMLGSLLKNALSNKEINYPQDNLKTSANDLQELVNGLEYILDNAVNAELRCVYCLHLVRNFTGHHFDLSETATSPRGGTFFGMYETSLTSVLCAIMYFKHIAEI